MKTIEEIARAANLLGRALREPGPQELIWGSPVSEEATRLFFALLALGWVLDIEAGPLEGVLKLVEAGLEVYDRRKESLCPPKPSRPSPHPPSSSRPLSN